MIKILIADDHVLIREGLKKLLQTAAEMIVAAEAENAPQVLEQIRNNELDVIILDISMPGKNGVELLQDIKMEWPKIPVLILTMHPEDRYALQAMKSGAAGYLMKGGKPEELIRAIRKVTKGRKYVSSNLAEKLAFNLDKRAEKLSHQQLSGREYQVFSKIAVGKTIRQMSKDLSLSMSTINTYRNRVLLKLKMKTDAEIIRYAIQNNLIIDQIS